MASKSDVGRPEGGTLYEKSKAESRKRVVIDLECEPVSVRYKPLPSNAKSKGFRCCMCGKEYTNQNGNFLKGGSQSPLWKGNGGYIPFCKACCEALYENYVAVYSGNEEHAIKHMCQMFDWYYDPIASSMTIPQSHRGGSRVSLYPSKSCIRQVIVRGETYLDTLKNDYKAASAVKIEDTEDVPAAVAAEEEDDDSFVVTKEMIRTWGPGFSKDQYQYLEEEFNDWRAKNICNTKTQEELYHNIALAQLDLRKARQEGGKVSDAQKTLLDLMNSANILPRQTADNTLADTQTFSTLIKKYEENDPIPEPDERWKDVDGIRRYVNTWFRGGLAKALKINNNENAELYEDAVKELNKYTVSPEKTRSESQHIDTSIFEDGGTESDGE